MRAACCAGAIWLRAARRPDRLPGNGRRYPGRRRNGQEFPRRGPGKIIRLALDTIESFVKQKVFIEEQKMRRTLQIGIGLLIILALIVLQSPAIMATPRMQGAEEYTLGVVL